MQHLVIISVDDLDALRETDACISVLSSTADFICLSEKKKVTQ